MRVPKIMKLRSTSCDGEEVILCELCKSKFCVNTTARGQHVSDICRSDLVREDVTWLHCIIYTHHGQHSYTID